MADLRVRTSIEMRGRYALAQHKVTTTEVRALVRAAIAYGIQHKRYELAEEKRFELTVFIADDTALAALNYKFTQKNEPTNVLAFPASSYSDTGRYYLGDIAISLETVEREAAMYGKSMRERILHMVVHAMLHLMGYDHMNDAERNEMERAEEELLAPLGVKDIYNG